MDYLVFFHKAIISLIILLLGVLLFFWSLPYGVYGRDLLHQNLGKYVYWLGLDTYWALFAPTPISKNFLIGFELELADGTRKPWKLPAYFLKEGFQATSHFRYIKLHNQLLSQPDPEPKEAICKFVHQQFSEKHPGGERVLRVHLLRYYQPAVTGSTAEIPWLSQRVYAYAVPSPKMLVS